MLNKIFKNKHLWINLEYKIADQVITNKLIYKTLKIFWKEKIESIKDDQYLMILFRIRIAESNDIKTVTKMHKITKNDLELLSDLVVLKLGVAHNAYFELPIKSIIISYGIREFKYLKNPFVNTLEETLPSSDIKTHSWYRHKMPISLNITEYGHILSSIENIHYLIKIDSKTVLNIRIEEKEGFKYHLIDFIKNNKKLYSFTDKIIEKDRLIRTIGQTIIDYKEGSYPVYRTVKKTKKIGKIKTTKNLENKIITADIETYLDKDNKMVPYLAAFFVKNEFVYEFNTNPDILFKNFFDKLFSRKYRDHQIYFHNFSGFDNFFLFKYLLKFGYKVDPIINKGKFIMIKIRKGRNKFIFKDSYLLLLSSLEKLAKSFNVETKKGIFPYFLTDLNYKGNFPDYKYFNTNKLSLKDYNKATEEFDSIAPWNFKKESIDYIYKDVKCLYEVLMKFSSLIYNQFNINISKYPTTPSLSFAIYRSHYLPEDQIPMITGKIKNDIKESYTGGSTDMYIPQIHKAKKIYAYDVNALYPYVMSKFDFPIGDPVYFEGEDLIDYKTKFGFFYVDIVTPLDLKHPILQIHHKTKDGIRTISPLGKFSGWFFSEELKNAEKFGYNYKILRGYIFDRGNIFKDFVEKLYNLRTSYPKSHPLNYLCKILLNSLYGRFGMEDNFADVHIIPKKDYPDFEEDYRDDIIDFIEFNNHYLVNTKNSELDSELGTDDIHNISIPIAAAVTAYARIHMSQFKNNPVLPNLYYSDTDSAHFDGPLPDSFISPTILGKMKLEGIFDRALFLAPKVYALKNDNAEIIKIKGLSKEAINNNNISLDSLEILLNKDYKLIFSQNKWFKNIDKANISILEQTYTLQVTENKRELIYNDQGILVDSKPFLIK